MKWIYCLYFYQSLSDVSYYAILGYWMYIVTMTTTMKHVVISAYFTLRMRLSPGHTVPIWRSRSLRSEKSWTSAWSAHEVVATSYWHLGSLLGRETIGSDREASTTKFYCKTLSCWSWLWLRYIHGSISVVCGIGNVVGLSYPAWGHSWTACGHSWTTYGWSWRSDQYNHSKLSNWCDSYVLICFKMCIYISVYISLSFKYMSIPMSWGRQ